jgi:Bacteriophage Lambda NinG protein.
VIAKKLRTRKCKSCREPFTPSRPLQSACGVQCAIALTSAAKEKARKAKEARERKESREAKVKLKTRSQYMREAQIAWNRYVRARDFGKECASCGARPAQKLGGTMDCSHYRSVGSSPHLRFHLHNAAAACVRCNRNLSGNIVELRKGLIARIGEAKVLAVECDQSVRKFTIDYLTRIKSIFTKKANRLERRRNCG